MGRWTTVWVMEHCALHGSASQMLSALRAVRVLFMPRDGLPVDIEANFRRMVLKSPELAQVNAAIDKATKEPTR